MIVGKNRGSIVYIPYRKGIKVANSNKYISNMIGILEDKYHVTGELANPLQISRLLKTKAVFLNWVEDDGLNKWTKVQLIFHKIFGAKIIWVFHNKYPHDAELNKVSTGNMNWLARHSSIIMLHSKSSRAYIPDRARNKKKAVYMPHILYEPCGGKENAETLKNDYGICGEDFVFTVFGSIKPYKNIESGIEAFKKMNPGNARLLIAGTPADIQYAKKIRDLCREDSAIVLDLHYLSNSKLDALIDISDVILLTYDDKSSMNSGVMIQAFSKGKTVIVPDICMARDLAEYRFFYMYKHSLDKVMKKAYENGKDVNARMGRMAKEYIYKNNNKDVVKNTIYNILK